MAFRFQKRIKLLPGVTLNVSKGGLSTSVGVKGARVTVGRGKTRTTVGLPGTGISHSVVSGSKSAPPQPSSAGLVSIVFAIVGGVFTLLLLKAIFF